MAMTKTPPYWDEKPSGATSKYREYPQRAKGTTSFIVFVFSIFVYMSIFYLFNISPSTFLNNNKFWFFISNTLILIIAADYGAFSSSKNKHDLYEEYVMHSQLARSTTTPTNISSFVSPKKEEVEYQSIQENQEKALEIVVVPSEPEKITENFQDDEKKKKKNYGRSKSEKPRRVVVVSKNIISSRSDYSETEKEDDDDDDIQEPAESVVEENDEFSNMSDEELNRRVEEFIQSFNRQIRLQRDGNLLPLNLVN